MKSRDGTSQRSEEKKKEYQKRESLRRKKIQVREKVGKPRNTVFFQWFVAPEGRKVGSLKWLVRSQLARHPNSSDEHVSCAAPAAGDAPLHIIFKCPTLAIVFGNATKPSRFAHFCHGAQSLAPATRNDIWTSKSAPDPSVFDTFDFEMCFAPQPRAPFRHLNFQKWSDVGVFCTFWLWNVLRPTTPCTFRHLNFQKWDLVCFVHFDFEMCFAPKRRALLRHLNFQKWPKPGVFCTFWLWHVLRATTACTFSTSQLQKVVRRWCVLYILTWKRASRHNGVQFFISHLASWLRTRRFSKPTFRPSGATNHWKKRSVSRLSYLFARLDLLSSETFSFLIFFLLLFSSLTLPISAFHLSTLSEVWPLNFLW